MPSRATRRTAAAGKFTGAAAEKMKVEKIKIDSEYIKLQDLLKLGGAVETGGQAKVVIQNGDVTVNGDICTMRGKKMRVGDTAVFDGLEIIVE